MGLKLGTSLILAAMIAVPDAGPSDPSRTFLATAVRLSASEIARLEEVYRRQVGIEQGVRQLEVFLDQRKAAEAEMALRILVQMAPDHPQRHQFEQRLRALKLGAR